MHLGDIQLPSAELLNSLYLFKIAQFKRFNSLPLLLKIMTYFIDHEMFLSLTLKLAGSRNAEDSLLSSIYHQLRKIDILIRLQHPLQAPGGRLAVVS